MNSDEQLEPIITDSYLAALSFDAVIEGWANLEHAPGFLEVRLRFSNGTVYSPMIADTFNTRILLVRKYTEQSAQSVKRGELSMTSMKDGWSKAPDVGVGAVIELFGVIDLGTARLLCIEISADFNRGQKYVVLNMEAVTVVTTEAKIFLHGFAYGIEDRGRVVMTTLPSLVEEEFALHYASFEERVAMFRTNAEAHEVLKFDV